MPKLVAALHARDQQLGLVKKDAEKIAYNSHDRLADSQFTHSAAVVTTNYFRHLHLRSGRLRHHQSQHQKE